MLLVCCSCLACSASPATKGRASDHGSTCIPAVKPIVSACFLLILVRCLASTVAASQQDVTSAQLRTLHIAGREGLHAPTLREFMAAFRAAGCRRPLIVEVKKVVTDGARMLLLQLLR
jgi:hypothetical protein